MTHNLTHLSIIVYEYIKNYNDIHNARVVYKELCKNIKSYIVVEFCLIKKRSSLRINLKTKASRYWGAFCFI